MGQQVLPFYLVCDESGSMDGEPIDAMNEALPDLHQEIAHTPVVADKTQFGIIGFSEDAEILLKLSDLSQVKQMPVLSAKTATNFAAAFRCVKEQIELDVDRLKQQGDRIYRPVVFFLTDGYPNTEDWKNDWEALTSEKFKYHPKIVAFGFGQANEPTISAVATFKAFMADGTLSPADALREFAVVLTKSVVESGSNVGQSGNMTVQVPDTVPGFTAIDVDEL